MVGRLFQYRRMICVERTPRHAPGKIHFGDMARTRAWWVVAPLLVILGLVLTGAYLGWFGPLVVCGADQVAVCVAWPGVVSTAVWALYILFFAGMAVWQILMWRREPTYAPRDDERQEIHGRQP